MFESLAIHHSWIVFIGTFFLGESIVLTASALAAGGVWPLWEVGVWAFLGTIVSDSVWFQSSRRGLNWYVGDGERGEKIRRVSHFAGRIVGGRPHRMLLIVKFLYGVRIATIVHLAFGPTRLRTFVLFDTMGTLIWLTVMLPLGYAIGKGLESVGADFRILQGGLVVAVVVLVVWKGWSRWRMAQET